MQQDEGRGVGSVRLWAAVVAVLFLLFGVLVAWDSRRLGASWGSDGPQAGYFPFYIGAFIVVASVMNLVEALKPSARGSEAFVHWGQLRMVLTVMIPTLVYVALIANPWYGLGIYDASALFIAVFMRYLGRYRWPKIALVSLATMAVFFVMFEVWFQVPLPKGPVEALLGYR
jgi:putative tricarboxylic transport membrane protein